MASQVKGYLKQLSTGDVGGQTLPPYELSEGQEAIIGRDPSCEIPLGINLYTGVSRRHLCIRWLGSSSEMWEVCDLDSSNGSFVNNQRLYGCQTLRNGDRLRLGNDGPEFVFELLQPTPLLVPDPPLTPPVANTGSSLSQVPTPPENDSVTFTQLFPIASTGKDLRNKAYLIPGILTVLFVVSMFAAVGEPRVYNFLIAAYISGIAYYYIYQLCGKPKSWFVLLASALTTSIILISPLLTVFIIFFREILPGTVPEADVNVSFLVLLINMFFGAGLMEELLKALPILGAYLVGRLFNSPWRERLGVEEPLDGILLGTASAVGFTLLETLGQYVPSIIDDITLQAGGEAAQLAGLHLLIPRILGSVAGHMAYSGYLGYFVGLSVLKPKKGWQILLVGYLTASFLHALWNASGYYSSLLLAIVGVISYAFLTAAILKARALSPKRSENFATRLYR
ncbi:MAG: PrsW family glutamic-type intramembrane protease [Spirulinaceae cyanobacterium]